MQYTVESEEAMTALGAELAGQLEKPTVLLLQGDLGAGKSVLARSIIHALGYVGMVKSPTYTLVETYIANDWRVAHLDLYRLHDPEELHFIGFRDVVGEHDLLLIEWPERAAEMLPAATLDIHISYAQNDARLVRVEHLKT